MSMLQADSPGFPVAVLPLRAMVANLAAPAAGVMRRLTDLRMLMAAGAELLWFASAIIVGLLLAGWLAGLIGLTPAPHTPGLLVL
jgi:hypothetical protein